jgi:hypothetical protein
VISAELEPSAPASRFKQERWVPIVAVALFSLATRVVALFLDPRIRFHGDAGSYFVGMERILNGAGGVLDDRPFLFTALWIPFRNLPHAELWIIAGAGALTTIAACICVVALGVLGVRPWIAILAGLALGSAPSVIFYEHTMASEATAYSVCLLAFSLAALGTRRHWGLLASALLLGFAGTTVRSAFLVLLVAGATAVAILYLVMASRTRPFWSSTFRSAALLISIGCSGAAGMLAGSVATGAAVAAPPLREIAQYQVYGAAVTLTKFAPLVDCAIVGDSARQSVCRSRDAALAARDALHGSWVYLFSPPMQEHTSQSSTTSNPDFKSQANSLVLSTVMSHPLGAAKLVLTEAWQLLVATRYSSFDHRGPVNGLTSERLADIASGISVPSSYPEPRADLLYISSLAQEFSRLFLVLLATWLSVRNRRQAPWIEVGLLLTWMISFAALAMTQTPEPRYLLTLDPLLFASIAFGVHRLWERRVPE